jgi:uncharacterized membrane protein
MTNRKLISRVAPQSVANIFGLMYLGFGLIFAVVMAVVYATDADAKVDPIFLIFMPIIYAIGGYLGGLIFAAMYNLVAGAVGGIVIDLADEQPWEE